MKNYYRNHICEVKKASSIITNDNQNKTAKNIFSNQIGYNNSLPKFATATNFEDGKKFYLKKVSDDSIVYTGVIKNQRIDFSDFINNDADDDFYLQSWIIKSYKFKVNDTVLFDVSLPPAIKFMEMSRQDAFDVGGETGYAWRDSHQFSFELNALVMLYLSNPDYFENSTKDIYKVNECEYAELQTQTEPNIIWLIKFGVTRYYKWATEENINLHAQIKAQLPYFLYLYPHITQYVTQEFYETIRDFTISIWSNNTCDKSWYNETPTHNLFATESTIGTVKGANPPGYSIIANLMMYEVLKRDNIDGYQNHFDSAYNSCKWIVDSVDIDDPMNTKGQRMSEYITALALEYFYENYTNTCPSGLYEKIERYVDVIISRSNNLWDYRQYSTNGDITGATETIWVNTKESSSGLSNQPGGIAGMCGICFAFARIIKDNAKVKRLKEIGISHLDHTYGRNPLGRHFCYTAKDDFVGGKYGWTKRYQGGFGNLGYVIGVLDGSPKEESYPFNPIADTGYTEGWVAFNTPWITSLAYLLAENSSINSIDIFNK